MSDYEEDFGDFPSEYEKESKHWLEHIAQSRHVTKQQEVGSQHKFNHFLMGQHSGVSARS